MGAGGKLGVAFLPGLASWSCFTPLPVSRRACLEQQLTGCPRRALLALGPLGKGTNPIPVLPCLCPLLGLWGDGCRGAAANHPTEDASPAWACCEQGERRASTHFSLQDLQKRCLLLLFPAKHGGRPGLEGWKPC